MLAMKFKASTVVICNEDLVITLHYSGTQVNVSINDLSYFGISFGYPCNFYFLEDNLELSYLEIHKFLNFSNLLNSLAELLVQSQNYVN